MKPLPLVRPAEHPLCPYCHRCHAIETQDVCYVSGIATELLVRLDRMLARP